MFFFHVAKLQVRNDDKIDQIPVFISDVVLFQRDAHTVDSAPKSMDYQARKLQETTANKKIYDNKLLLQEQPTGIRYQSPYFS